MPAYFTVIIQLANVGPLLYGVMAKKLKWFNKDHKIETFTIYLIISIGEGLPAEVLDQDVWIWARITTVFIAHFRWLIL